MGPKTHKHLPAMALIIVLCVMITGPDIAAAKPISKQAAAAQIKSLKVKAHKSQSAIRFWQDRERGRWRLHLRHKECKDIYGKQRRKVCKYARQMYRFQKVRLVKLKTKIEKLTVPRDTGYLPPDEARELGRRMAEEYGWTGKEWDCLDALWGRYESSWYVYADNPHSSAYGIPQATPGSKMASAGVNWRNSAYVQIKWGLRYIAGTYGTPCSALSVRLATMSY